LDTSSIINGYLPTHSTGNYTVAEVVEEAKSLVAKASVNLLIDTGHLQIWEASPSSVSVVERRLGDIGGELSPTDTRVAALALDLRKAGRNPVVLTDDYGLQNIARVLGLEYRSVATRGITSVFEWQVRCPGCGRTVRGDARVCPDCGSRLTRVVRRRRL
jgi:UPF0271 protein